MWEFYEPGLEVALSLPIIFHGVELSQMVITNNKKCDTHLGSHFLVTVHKLLKDNLLCQPQPVVF